MPFANSRRHRAVTEDASYTTYRYYDTDILKVSRCRSHVVINTGNFRTVSTKNAINDALRDADVALVVYQKNFCFHVTRTSSSLLSHRDAALYDAITIKLI